MMMVQFRIVSTIILLFVVLTGNSQNLSNKGKEFWVGYGHHQFFESGGNTQQMVLYLSADQPATVTVSINGTSYSHTYSVAANSVISTLPLPKSGTDDCRLYSGAAGFTGSLSEGFSDRGIHIESDVPIVAYAHIYGSQSSGATMLMPTETWGYSYTSVNSKQSYASNCFSWMFIVAKENNTKVQVIPSGPSRGGKPAGIPFEIVLNKGQIYQLLGASIDSQDGYELTGSTVKSIANSAGECFPIAVFSGSSRTWNPASCGSGGGDNDIQQLFPSQAWGKRYLTAPTSISSNAAFNQTNTFKILIKDPATVVKRNGVVLTGLIANTYYLFESNTADYITADKPIMVAQFMTGGGCGGGGSNVGDPEMIYISPIEQGIKRIGFYRNNQQAININYLTLIIPSEGLNSLTIDGSSSFTYSYDHPELPGYTVVVKRWNAAQAQCIVQSDSAFTAITYGLGSVESYGYNAGTLINNLNVIGEVHNAPDSSATTNQFTCRNTPAEISILVAYKPTSMVWNLSQVPMLSPNADVSISSPVPVDSVVQFGTKYYKYNLPGSYTFSDTGTFSIPVKNTHPSIDNCNNSEIVRFNISVKVSPINQFPVTNNAGCIMDSVQFMSAAQSGIFSISKWNWTFPDGSTSSLQNPAKIFSSPGVNNIHLQIISAEGCVGDTTLSVNVFAKPVSTFGTSPLTVCEGSSVSFSDTSSYGGPGPIISWYWDFGNSTYANVSNNNTQNVVFPAYGNYIVKHVVKVSNTCISDTVSRIVKVYAKPNLSLSYPAGCLPTNGLVQFNNNTTVADGQPLTYSWNFGDPNANGSNPNTSTSASPAHNYSVGMYTIHYSALTSNGCQKDTTINASFNLKPLLSYPVLSSICSSVKGTVSVASGSVTNGVSGNGFYRGLATDSSGNFRPSLAGPGVHTIWFVFSSSGGCKDSISTTVKVFPKPIGNFTVDPDICFGETATIADHSTLASGNIVSWQWNFGDATSNTTNNSASFTKAYSAFGNYTVKLVAISDSSCTSDTVSHTIAVHPKPVVNFALPLAVCMPGGMASFTNSTSSPDNAPITYQWNFGDFSSNLSTQNPTHVYATSGYYSVTLTATTSFGCSADTSKILSSFYDKPVAMFAVSPDTLCQGTNNVFADLSPIPGNPIQSWNWNFGDGTSSTSSSPVKNYSRPGNYVISLTVKNVAGCTSDPFKDTVIVYLQPKITAGPSFIVPEGTIIRFNPTVNDSSVLQFLWTPSGDFPDPTILRPTLLAMHNQQYTLTATGQGNCTASSSLTVKILKPVIVPNSFSPNGDGINDTWKIPNLSDYPGCNVEVYNRYGQLVYRSYGYGTPWDGRYNGSVLPFATYYYIITLKNGFAPVTGSVTIVK